MLTRNIVISIILAQLAGCGSGGAGLDSPPAANVFPGPTSGGGNTTVHIEGIWQGIVTPDTTNTSGWAVVIVNGWGEFRLLTTEAQFVGAARRTISEIEGELIGLRSPGTTWNNGTRVSSFTIAGSIAEDDFIDATYTGSTGSGTVAVSQVSDSTSAEITSAAGTWVLFDDDQNIVASLGIDLLNVWTAAIYGTHTNGCTYAGALESWTSKLSYDIGEMTVIGCPHIAGVDVNGDYSGTAAIIDVDDDSHDGHALVVGLSNDVNQLTFFFYRP